MKEKAKQKLEKKDKETKREKEKKEKKAHKEDQKEKVKVNLIQRRHCEIKVIKLCQVKKKLIALA